MDIISGEYSSLFIQYSGIDIRVSLLSRFLLFALLYFTFFEVSFFLFFFIHFFCKFYWKEKTEEVYKTKI